MTRGSVQLRHKKECPATGKDPRACRCGPTAYAVIYRKWHRVGYLDVGWKKADLLPFELKLSEVRSALENGEPVRQARVVLLDDYAREWLADMRTKAASGQLSLLTYNTYEGNWTNHLQPAFGHMPLRAIDEASIRRYVDVKKAEGLAPVTAQNSLTPLSGMLTDAVDDKLIARNPAQRPRRARHGGSRRRAVLLPVKRVAPKHLEIEEARSLLAATTPLYRDMVLTALTTGFRRGELLGLKWEDVNFGTSRIRLQRQLQNRREVQCKCDSERVVVLCSTLAQALGPRRRSEGYVFTDAKGRSWTNEGPAQAFLIDAYKAAGLRRRGVLWHALRHTYASVLADAGIRREVVENLMGHAPSGTTSIYTHLFHDAFDGVAEALDEAFGVNQASTNRRATEERSGTSDDGSSHVIAHAAEETGT